MGKHWCISPLLAGIVVDQLGWSMTLQLLIVPAVIAAILWFFVKPDKPLVVNEAPKNK
ncbi:glucarate transporter [Staphylococcus saccharolyticus]|uniref:Glucarate transporter n=1 Tax=Staphylococcus saccharolyticus TaxID=33028 RepID=A0A380H0A4_9STAP|nr:glucarate transporter [Staphylococcus saccharolyticus]